MIFRSIRWRLQAWHGLILCLVLGAFGVTAYRVVSDNQMRRIDRELEQQLAFVFHPPPPGPKFGPRHPDSPGPGRPGRDFGPDFRLQIDDWLKRLADAGQTNAFYFVAWDSQGKLLGQSTNAPTGLPIPEPGSGLIDNGGPEGSSAPGPAQRTRWRTRGEWREAFQIAPFGNIVLVGRSIAPDLASLRRLSLWLAAAGSAVLALGLMGGWWMASRAIRPIAVISAAATKIAEGDLSQRISTAQADTEFQNLVNVLNSTFSRLETVFEQQARFTSDASHELRTPLSVILMHTQSALSRPRSDSEYKEALLACERAAQRMRGLTDSLLELARLDSAKELLKHEKFDLARLAKETVTLIRPLAEQRSVRLECELASVECVGDPERLAQVLTNLLSNAIYFNRENGSVRVCCSSEKDQAVLKVSDTGQGIAVEHLPHIFERFYRVDKSRSRAQGKAGLGLAICKAIVEAHGGDIQVTSTVGEGSSFRVSLPIAPPS